MSFKDKLKNILTPIEDDEYLELTDEEVESLSDYETLQGSVTPKLPSDAKMILFEPRSFEESEEVARYLKEKRAAVVNLHRLQRDYAQRTIDFLTGVVFALDGSIQKIGHNVILCTPKTIGVEGEISMNIEDLDS
ncbi:cell division protein SepF [Erysipelothrix inopinata]|uniref:Cell division protein SepF n=1 Tax=Erysipelothrix inopinata TaxID=225084 RepID=A0A7G9S1U6_9FIRM|nr:cell division protein SepF [Erysipelothrix inopinata]QNN61821.1 cell division protein SepF [Erysipelothrix inopinata]